MASIIAWLLLVYTMLLNREFTMTLYCIKIKFLWFKNASIFLPCNLSQLIIYTLFWVPKTFIRLCYPKVCMLLYAVVHNLTFLLLGIFFILLRTSDLCVFLMSSYFLVIFFNVRSHLHYLQFLISSNQLPHCTDSKWCVSVFCLFNGI